MKAGRAKGIRGSRGIALGLFAAVFAVNAGCGLLVGIHELSVDESARHASGSGGGAGAAAASTVNSSSTAGVGGGGGAGNSANTSTASSSDVSSSSASAGGSGGLGATTSTSGGNGGGSVDACMPCDPMMDAACTQVCQGAPCKCDPVTIASVMGASLEAIAVDATHVYFATGQSGDIRSVLLDGTSPNTVATDATGIYYFAIDASNVYWTSSLNKGSISTAPLTGGNANVIVGDQQMMGIPATQIDPRGIVVLGSAIYWAAYGTPNDSGAVWSAKNNGDFAYQVSMNVLYGNTDVVTNGSYLFGIYKLQGKNGVWRIDLTDPDAGLVKDVNSVTMAPSVGGIAVDSQKLYFANSFFGTIDFAAVEGGASFAILAQGQDQPGPIAADVSGVYWANTGSGEIMVKRPNEPAPKKLATELKTKRIALDATHVYWTTDDGYVRKVHK